MVAFKGLNVILGLHKYNYSLTKGKETPSENEFDTPILEHGHIQGPFPPSSEPTTASQVLFMLH